MAEQEQEITPEMVNEFIAAQVREQTQALFAERERQQQQQQPDYQDRQRQQQQQELRQIIDPVYGNDIRQANLQGMSAEDATLFYTRHPDAVEDMDRVENLFRQAMQNGRPTARAAIYRYMQGEDYTRDPEGFMKKHEAKVKKQLERAQSAIDPGIGAAGMMRSESTPIGSLDDFSKLSAEEMEKRIAATGWTF